jgi:lipopolysaccharide export LptBFGC system permease protein LptF
MNLDNLPGLRLLKIKAAITYLELIKKARKLFIYLLCISVSLLLMCVSLILIGLSFLREFNMGVFLFGIGIILIAAVLMGFLLAQRAWMRIFGIDQLIENIKKGDAK